MNLLDLMVTIGVDDKTSEGIGKASSNIKGKLATAAKVGVAAVGALTAAIGGTTAAIGAAVGQVAEYGDNIDKMSQKMGISATAYQEWDAVMQHSGTSMESLKAGMKTLANAVENGNDAFQRIGLTQEQIANMSQEELFAKTIEGLQNVENETERMYLAGQLLGRGATELGPLLNSSAEETQAMKDRVHELGGVMSDEAVKASARFQDSLQDMQTAITGIRNSLVGEFLPAATAVTDGLQEIFSGNIDAGFDMVVEGIGQGIDKISEMGERIGPKIEELVSVIAANLEEHGPEIASKTGTLLGNMVKGIVSAIPSIISGLGSLLAQIIVTIPQWGPQLLEAAVLLFVNIVQGITEVTVDVLNAIAELLGQAISAVAEYAAPMAEAAAEFVQGIPAAIESRAGEIVAAVQAFVSKAVNAVSSKAASMISAAGRFISGFVSGITSGAARAASAASGMVSRVVSVIRELPGRITGALGNLGSLLMNAGSQIIQGLINGIQAKIGEVQSKLASLTKLIPSWKGPADVDKMLLYGNGQLIMDGLVRGIDSGIPGLRSELGDVTRLIGGTSADMGFTTKTAMANAYGGGDIYNVYLQIEDPNDYNAMAMAFTNAVETRNRMRGRESSIVTRMV